MNQTEINNKIEKLLNDEAFCNKFFALKNAEEMSAELAKYDVDLTADDIRNVKKLVQKKEAGELTDEELQNVAGGSLVAGIIYGIVVGGGFGIMIYRCIEDAVC